MSIANEEQFPTNHVVETNDESKKKPKISYKREFLLSLSDVDESKKLPILPSEFSESLLRCYEDPLPEQRRVSGDFSSYGLRRNDYSSSPPNRGELGSHTRGINGKWEGRSGGWNDKDGDSHSDRDPGEPGRRGMPSRRPWQTPEHDGLLGKGSFPKPPGFGAGASSAKPLSNDSYQLRRSNEPYHPPRPYKASTYTRRDTRDSFNDETFGSSDSTSEDRAEEERKRRASFELLRKEHQKAFQERQKLNPDLRKNDFDFTELLGEPKDEKRGPSRNDEVHNAPTLPGSNNISFPPQSSAPRPLVPPGFASTILERKQGEKPHTEISQHESSRINPKVAEAQGHPRKTEQSTLKFDQKKSLEISDGPSILDKLFNTAINLNGGNSSNISEVKVEEVEETQSPQTVKSSKFAHLFLEEDNKPVKDLPSSRPPRGLLTLLQGADNLQTFDIKARGDHLVEFPLQGHGTKDQLINTSTSKTVAAAPPILTCEDLEQSILSEVGEGSYQSPLPAEEELSASSVKTKQRKTSADDQASLHLLSLLQKPTDQKSQDTQLHTITEKRPPPTAGEAESGKSLTLETLFGSAFMNELQSIGEPISRRSGVSDAPGLPLHTKDNGGLLPGGIPLRSDSELSQRDQTRPDSLPGGRLRPAGVGFSEDGNLLSDGNRSNPTNYMALGRSPNQEPDVTFSIKDELAALNSGPRNERPTIGSQDSQFLHHPPQYAIEPSSHPQFQPSHMNGSGAAFHPFDSRHATGNSQLNFMAPGSLVAHQDPLANHRFPATMIRPPFQHATTGPPDFDRLPPHILQKMHMQASLQHPHAMQGFPGGPAQHHPHLNNQLPGRVPELIPSQGFPFAHRHPHYMGNVPQVNRGDHPASLQTLLGISQRMEPPKQIPTAGQTGGPQRQGSLSHELDHGFGYR